LPPPRRRAPQPTLRGSSNPCPGILLSCPRKEASSLPPPEQSAQTPGLDLSHFQGGELCCHHPAAAPRNQPFEVAQTHAWNLVGLPSQTSEFESATREIGSKSRPEFEPPRRAGGAASSPPPLSAGGRGDGEGGEGRQRVQMEAALEAAEAGAVAVGCAPLQLYLRTRVCLVLYDSG